MGQVQGSPAAHKNIVEFLLLPKDALESLWMSYNLLGEGWGLAMDDVNSIIFGASNLVASSKITKKTTQLLFNCFDTDSNGLVDALEMIVTIALISGMDTIEKLQFVFCAYDFDNKGSISYDETALLLRSVASGCAKAFPSAESSFSLSSGVAEKYVHLLFTSLQRSQEDRVSAMEFNHYCMTHPIIKSWLRYVSSIPSLETIAATDRLGEEDFFEVSADRRVSLNVACHPAADIRRHLSSSDFIDLKADVESRMLSAQKQAEENPPKWFAVADLSRPEEVPVQRTDQPEDVFEPVWVHGINSCRQFKGIPAVYDAAGSIVYASGRHALLLSNNSASGDEGAASGSGWTQTIRTEHSTVIEHLAVSEQGTVLATAGRSISTSNLLHHQLQLQQREIVVQIWNTQAGLGKDKLSIVSGFALSAEAELSSIDLSKDGRRLLVIQKSTAYIASIFDIENRRVVFQAPLALRSGHGPGSGVALINEARFALSPAIFAVASTEGICFYMEEPGSPSSSSQSAPTLLTYEKRAALYQQAGKAAAGKSCTALARFDFSDEIVSGTIDGDVLLWRGRSCTACLSAVHPSSPVVSLHYSRTSQLVVSAGADSRIVLLKLSSSAFAKNNGLNKSRVNSANDARRGLEVVSIINLSRHGILQGTLRSAYLSFDGSKAVATTVAGSMFEFSCIGPAPPMALVNQDPKEHESSEEDKVDSPPADTEVERDSSSSTVKLGDDLNNGPLVNGFSNTASIVGVARAAGGFVTSSAGPAAGDCSLQLWGAADGAPQRLIKTAGLDAGCFPGCLVTNAGLSLLAVALDGSTNASRRGIVQLFALPDLSFVAELTNMSSSSAAVDVLDIKFSVDGNTLVATTTSSSSNQIYIFALSEGAWSLKVNFPVPSSPVTRFDLSTDAVYLRAQLASGDLVVFDIANAVGNPVSQTLATPAAASEVLRPLAWSTSTCLYAWDTKGLFNHLSSGEEVSWVTCSDRFNHLFLLAGQDGTININRVPNSTYRPSVDLNKLQMPRRLSAHTGPVGGMCFLEEGARLVTAGKSDGALVVWKVLYDTEEPELDDESGGGSDKVGDDAAAEEGEAEGEEGKPRLEKVYDSGEDEDLEDLNALKKPLMSLSTLSSSAEDRGLWSAVKTFAGDVGLDFSQLRENGLSYGASSAVNPTGAVQLPPAGKELSPRWIHGFSSRTTRGSVKYNSAGQIIYPTSTYAIIFDKVSNSQQVNSVLSGHHSAGYISCLDVHLPSNTGVSGSAGGSPGSLDVQLVLWDASTGETLQQLSCGAVNGLSAVAFSSCGRFVAVACQDLCHTVKVFDWRNGCLRCETSSSGLISRQKILTLSFSHSSSASLRLLQGGVAHYSLIDLKAEHGSQNIIAKTGLYGAGLRKHTVLCSLALPLPLDGGNEFLLGFSNGSVGVLARGERKVASYFPVGSGRAVTALALIKSKDSGVSDDSSSGGGVSYKVVVACVEGNIRILDQEFQQLASYNLYYPAAPAPGKGKGDDGPGEDSNGNSNNSNASSAYGLHQIGRARGFKSICVDRFNRKILYGTSAGEIGEIDLETGKDVNDGPIVQSHFKQELHGLAVHPLRQECITGGDDRTLKIWNLDTNKMTQQIDLPGPVRSVAITTNGQIIAAGIAHDPRLPAASVRGKVAIVSYMQGVLRIIHVIEDAAMTVSAVAFSPNGSRLFCGSLDSKVYVYDAWDNFNPLQAVTENSQEIVALDVSKPDGKLLVSFGREGEVRVMDTTAGCARVTEDLATVLGQAAWYMRHGPFGLDSFGVFEKQSCLSDVGTLCLSQDGSMLASGDVLGRIKLLPYPTRTLDTPFRAFHGHAPGGGVAKVCFTAQDKHLVSIGKSDRTLVIWRVKSRPDSDESSSSMVPAILAPPEAKPLSSSLEDNLGHSFDSSFVIKGTEISSSSKEASSLPAVVSFSHCVGLAARRGAASSALSLYCGLGAADVVTSFGNSSYIISRNKITQHPVSILDNYCSKASTSLGSHLFHSGRGLSEIGAGLAVSDCGRFLVLGTACPSQSEPYLASRAAFLGRLVVVFASTRKILNVLSDSIAGGIVGACFSSDGAQLATLAGDFGHTLRVFASIPSGPDGKKWKVASLLHEGFTSAMHVSLLTFISYPTAASGDNNDSIHSGTVSRVQTGRGDESEEGIKDKVVTDDVIAATTGGQGLDLELDNSSPDLVIAGEGFIKFWKIKGNNVIGLLGAYEAESRPLTFTSLTSIRHSGNVISGDKDGNVCLWNGIQMVKRLGSHSSTVSALTSFSSLPAANSNSLSFALSRLASTADTHTRPDVALVSPSVLSKSSRKLSKQFQKLSMASPAAALSSGFISASNDSIIIWDGQTLAARREISLTEVYIQQPLSATTTASAGASIDADSRFVTSLSVDASCSRLLLTSSDLQLSELAVDSGYNHIIQQGDRRTIKGWLLAGHPVNRNLIVTITAEDNAVNVWNISQTQGQAGIIGYLKLDMSQGHGQGQGPGQGQGHNVTSLNFLTPELLAVGLSGADTGGKCGSILFLRLSCLQTSTVFSSMSEEIGSSRGSCVDLSVVHRIHNLGRGGVLDVKLAPSRQLLTACSEDGFVYLFSNFNANSSTSFDPTKLASIGSLKTYASNVPVVGADFSTCSKYLATFGACKEGDHAISADYFDVQRAATATMAPSSGEPAVKLSSSEDLTALRAVSWATTSSPANPAARGTYSPLVRSGATNVTSVKSSSDGRFVVAGYTDGSVGVYRSTSSSLSVDASLVSNLYSHASSSSSIATFVGGADEKLGLSQRICSYGFEDKCFIVWEISP